MTGYKPVPFPSPGGLGVSTIKVSSVHKYGRRVGVRALHVRTYPAPRVLGSTRGGMPVATERKYAGNQLRAPGPQPQTTANDGWRKPYPMVT